MAQRGGIMIVNGNDIEMIRGDSETIGLTFRHEAKEGQEKGDLVEFEEGDILYFTVKRSVNTETRAIQKKIDLFTNSENGEVNISINPEDTSHLDYGNYVYDMQFSKHDGTVKTIIPPSDFIIGGEVTYE